MTDKTKLETDKLCADAALLFTARDKLARDIARIDARLNRVRAEYMEASKEYGLSPDHLRRSCKARGLLT